VVAVEGGAEEAAAVIGLEGYGRWAVLLILIDCLEILVGGTVIA